MPTLRALECLVAVVETGSVTAAAQHLNASQPAVSHQLVALERELGIALVERLPRGVRPTVAGQAVLEHAQAALAAADQVRDTGRAIAAGRGGVLRIGCAASMMVAVLPPVLSRWRRTRPDIELAITEADSADRLESALADGRIDVALTPRPSTTSHVTTVIGVEQIMVAMSTDHPLARRAEIPIAILGEQPIIGYTPGHGLGSWLDAHLARHDVTVLPVMRTQQIIAVAQLASAGIGLGLVPEAGLPAGLDVTLRPLTPALTRDVVALRAGDRDPIIAQFISDLRSRGLTR